jgi:hypothetical protein
MTALFCSLSKSASLAISRLLGSEVFIHSYWAKIRREEGVFGDARPQVLHSNKKQICRICLDDRRKFGSYESKEGPQLILKRA